MQYALAALLFSAGIATIILAGISYTPLTMIVLGLFFICMGIACLDADNAPAACCGAGLLGCLGLGLLFSSRRPAAVVVSRPVCAPAAVVYDPVYQPADVVIGPMGNTYNSGPVAHHHTIRGHR